MVSHPVRITLQWSHHPHEEWLLQEGKHSTNHGLQARQSAKVIGWIAKYTNKQLEDKTNRKYCTYFDSKFKKIQEYKKYKNQVDFDK